MDLINKLTKIIFKFFIFKYEINFTNLMLITIIAPTSFLLFFFILSLNFQTRKILLVCYDFFYNHFAQKYEKDIEPYIPFLFSIFCFLYSFNFFGLIPYFFPATSNFFFNLTISGIVFVFLLIILFKEHGIYFYNAFCPKNVPFLIRIFLFCLEFFLFLIKPITLAIRLSFNIAIGHLILEFFSSFAKNYLSYFGVTLILFVMNIFEILMGLLQSYIFVNLSASYIKDLLNHH